MHIDKLDDIINKYSNIYHSTIKMKPVHVKSSTYIDFIKKIMKKNPKFKIDEKVTSNKTKYVLVENELNELCKKVEVISTKGLTKALINVYKILNAAKYFSLGMIQNYLVFISAKNYFNFLLAQLKFIYENLKGCQKQILKI